MRACLFKDCMYMCVCICLLVQGLNVCMCLLDYFNNLLCWCLFKKFIAVDKKAFKKFTTVDEKVKKESSKV